MARSARRLTRCTDCAASESRACGAGTSICRAYEGLDYCSRAALRNFFEVDSRFIVLATLYALMRDKQIEAAVVEQAIKDLRIETEKPNPAIS